MILIDATSTDTARSRQAIQRRAWFAFTAEDHIFVISLTRSILDNAILRFALAVVGGVIKQHTGSQT